MDALACGATHATAPGSSGGGGSGDPGSGGKMGSDEIGGFVGSAGRSAGASGDGGAAGLGGARQCRPSGPPASDSNAKHTPVEAIRSLAIEAPAPADACEHPPPSGAGGVAPLGSDACGCSGLSCAESQVCVNAVVELGAACGQPQRANQCFATCASDADCGDDQICLPAFAANEFARCFKAGCRTGSECCSGRCLVSTGYRSQCNPNVVLQIECQ